jgi:hypothetical protein
VRRRITPPGFGDTKRAKETKTGKEDAPTPVRQVAEIVRFWLVRPTHRLRPPALPTPRSLELNRLVAASVSEWSGAAREVVLASSAPTSRTTREARPLRRQLFHPLAARCANQWYCASDLVESSRRGTIGIQPMKPLNQLRTWWTFRGDLDKALPRIWTQWGGAKAVYADRVGYGARQPFENRLASLLIERHPNQAMEFFLQGLAHPNPKVVGYSLLGIALLDRHVLKTAEIPQSERTITWYFGCRGTDCSLERLRQILLST